MLFGIFLASLALGVVGTVSQMISSQDALQEQEEMLHSQALENKYKTLARKNQTLDEMSDALSKNIAHEAVTGFAFGSPTFVSQNAYIIHQGDEALKHADIASALNDYSYQMEDREARTQNDLRQIGNIVDFGTGAGNEFYRYHTTSKEFE